ncbi:MAG: phosphoribosylanthranilate isomerase, partial [Tannerella sp.]|nr:phosphoribosylanthranilate isomerase [Tannerella sp.]
MTCHSRLTIKVCGMREAGNILAVQQLDIDWIGFIFYPPSPRHVSGDAAAEAIRRCTRTKVGVFVDAGISAMVATAEYYGLDCVQLHGNESPETCLSMQTRGYSVVKAFSVATAGDLQRTKAYEAAADCFLFDTKCEGFGGSGRRFDWSALHGYDGRTPFLLSGGLAPGCEDELLQLRH